MVIKEDKLRQIVKTTVTNFLKESFDDVDFDVVDDWDTPDEDDMVDMDAEPTDDQIMAQDTEEKPENLSRAQKKKEMVDALLRKIYAKQGKNPADIDKSRTGNHRFDSDTLPDSYYNKFNVNSPYNNMDSGVGYNDDDFELYEAVKGIVKKVLSEQK